MKKLVESTQAQVGTLTKTDGTHTEAGLDTINEMINTHYPSNEALKPTEYNWDNRVKLDEVATLYTDWINKDKTKTCLLYTSPSPRDLSTSRMPSSA